AITHLCLLACGVKSQIWGEDQIITQVKEAITFAREQQSADSILEVLFRTAVACGKKVKTELRLTEKETSIANKLLEQLTNNENEIKQLLVIGNGEIGRLTATKLLAAGYQVTMTVRQYLHHPVAVPEGATVIDYARRYEYFNAFDGIVSATLSPHFTVETAKLQELSNFPHLFFDLAVPRDIEKSVGKLPGVTLHDVDSLSSEEHSVHQQRMLQQIDTYIDKYKTDFYKWDEHRQNADAKKQKFPLFVDINGKTAVVVGAGKIAQRRILTLSKFALQVVVIAPTATDEIKKLAQKKHITYLARAYQPADLEQAFLVLAVTDDRALNQQIGITARALGKFVSVADSNSEGNFFFPAVIERNEITIALCGDGIQHTAVADTAKQLRGFFDHEN
ncbi:MAG: NAD(P)-dependent oxidoreductase, partial [Clostridiales bacterium]